MGKDRVSADFPFESKFVEVRGSSMHYIDEGSGDPVLFLHGNPTSSYLWRNIIPYLTSHARCIAPDLMGMGKSEKPNIGYNFIDHAAYIEEFINKMGLENVTLVIHDWGSALGFHYAMRNEDNIKGIAFMEAIIAPVSWDDFPPEFSKGFRLFRAPVIGWFMISVLNVFVEKILPRAIVRDLTDEEMRHYRAPFQKIRHRKPVRVWPREIPIEGKPKDVHRIVAEYNRRLAATELPMLLFHASPGAILRKDLIEWCKKNLSNLTTVDLGKGIHFLQEDHPHRIGEELAKWYRKI